MNPFWKGFHEELEKNAVVAVSRLTQGVPAIRRTLRSSGKKITRAIKPKKPGTIQSKSPV